MMVSTKKLCFSFIAIVIIIAIVNCILMATHPIFSVVEATSSPLRRGSSSSSYFNQDCDLNIDVFEKSQQFFRDKFNRQEREISSCRFKTSEVEATAKDFKDMVQSNSQKALSRENKFKQLIADQSVEIRELKRLNSELKNRYWQELKEKTEISQNLILSERRLNSVEEKLTKFQQAAKQQEIERMVKILVNNNKQGKNKNLLQLLDNTNNLTCSYLDRPAATRTTTKQQQQQKEKKTTTARGLTATTTKETSTKTFSLSESDSFGVSNSETVSVPSPTRSSSKTLTETESLTTSESLTETPTPTATITTPSLSRTASKSVSSSSSCSTAPFTLKSLVMVYKTNDSHDNNKNNLESCRVESGFLTSASVCSLILILLWLTVRRMRQQQQNLL